LIDQIELKNGLGNEFLIVLDEKNKPVDGATHVKDVLSASKTLTLDFKDHFVLEMVTMENDKPKFHYRFVTIAEIKGKNI
jgi:hypothetical protein